MNPAHGPHLSSADICKISAEEILRERFARGEIWVEEYERSLKTLCGEPAQRTYEDIARETRQQRT